jgi:hypothetical protein
MRCQHIDHPLVDIGDIGVQVHVEVEFVGIGGDDGEVCSQQMPAVEVDRAAPCPASVRAP